MMNREHWNKVKEVFHAAVDVEVDHRAAFLERACNGDAALRVEVESLLASHREGDAFIDPPDFSAVSDLLREGQAESRVGQRVGAYELVRLLGSGGMANVYLGRRADGQFEHQVAVKLMKLGMDTAELVRRFQVERQTLADLDHPNIARLIDGGVAEDGRPYLIMEYVEGARIDAYCDERNLPVRDRLNLFRTICAAVHYAHQNLVVHRDLKPANILVTAEGVPKLLDFGIAKLLDPERGGADASLTSASPLRLMTPDYASPEQIRRERISTAADVYSLGIVLYELLSGHHPFRDPDRSGHRLERAICEEDPQRPSTVVGQTMPTRDARGTTRTTITPATVSARRAAPPDVLRRTLGGDLDNIVMMALRKEPQRRYASAREFSEDIRRYFEGLPVLARPDTFRYRAGKFISRHRHGTAAAVLIAATLVAGLAGTLHQAGRARDERDAARANLLRAQAAERSARIEAARAREQSEAAERVTAFLVDLFGASDPDESLGQTLTARDMLDRGAARIADELADQPRIQATLYDTIGKIYRVLALYDPAETYLTRALQISRRTYGARTNETADRLNNLGVLKMARADIDGAEALYREAYEIRTEVLPDDDPDLATTLGNLSSVARERGNFAEAETMLRRALAIRRKAYGEDHPDVISSLNNLAGLLYTRGDLAGAEETLRDLLGASRRVLGPTHTNVARILSNLGLVMHIRGDTAGAKPLYEESLAIRRKLLGPDHPDVASTLNNLGGLMIDRGEPAAAEPYFREAVDIYRRVHDPGHPLLVAGIANLGQSLRRQGRFDEARPLLMEAMEARRRSLPGSVLSLSSSLVDVGLMKLETGDASGAEKMLREALETRLKEAPPGHWLIAEAQSALGAALTALGRHEEAEALLNEAYPALRAARGEPNVLTREARRRLATLYAAWGKPDRAREFQTPPEGG